SAVARGAVRTAVVARGTFATRRRGALLRHPLSRGAPLGRSASRRAPSRHGRPGQPCREGHLRGVWGGGGLGGCADLAWLRRFRFGLFAELGEVGADAGEELRDSEDYLHAGAGGGFGHERVLVAEDLAHALVDVADAHV